MSPILTGSPVIRHSKHSNAIEIHNGHKLISVILFFFAPCSIVRSFEVLVSIFARQLEYGDWFSLVTENVLFVAELVSWVAC